MKQNRQRHAGKRTKQAASAPPLQRIPLIDALRGGAVIAMIFYHFGYDLNYLGWLHQAITHDLRWLTARTLILGTFLLTTGIGLALAEGQQTRLKTRWMRIGKIAAAAALVTVGSWLMFPKSAIYFGTLHAIALMNLLLLLRPLAAMPAALLGVCALGLGNVYANALFNHPALAWIGLMTYKPLTEDYVPMLPWFGVCLIGYAAMKALISRGPMQTARGPHLPRFLLWTGRHSLPIYLLHQPLLLGILIPITPILRQM